MNTLRLAATVAAMLALIPVSSPAADQDDALRLAERIASGSTIKATVTLRAAPAELPGSLPLPAATLLGSASHPQPQPSAGAVPWLQWHRVELYYDAPDRDATTTAYQTVLGKAGWKKSDLATRFPSPAALTIPQLNAWCSPDKPPTVLAIGLPQGLATAVTVTVTSGGPLANLACGNEPPL